MQADFKIYYGNEFDKLTEQIVSTIIDLTKAQLNQPVREGAWSPGQHIEHLILSERQTLKLLNGPTEQVDDRKPDEKCARLDSLFREPKERFKTHESLDPDPKDYRSDELLDQFVDIRADQRAAFELADDIAGECHMFKHPLLGYMTKCEWFFFSAIHGERHRIIVQDSLS